MAMLTGSPMTETLSKAAGEEVVKKYEVDIGENRRADLVVFRGRINIYLESSDTPVAVLRFGSPHSGALWLEGDLVGEFSREPAGAFEVIEIQKGFKSSETLESTDPIEYLLNRL